MPSTYTVNLGIEKPATGEQSGTWGDTTNVNFDIIDQAVNGSVRVTLTSAGTSGSPNDLNIVNGSTTSSEGRNKWIEIYSASDLGGSAYVRLVPNDAEKILFIRNSLAGSQSVLLFQGTYNASNDLEIPAGVDMVVKFDGAGASATVTDVFTKLRATEITTPTLTAGTADINGGSVDGATVGAASASTGAFTTLTASTSLNIASSTTVDGVLDEDNMASDSATKLATQQSIKAYVDSQVGTVDTWAEVLANGATSGATNPEIDSGQVLKTNTINETTTDAGVTIDSVLVKDNSVKATTLKATNLQANDGTAAGSIDNSTGLVRLTSVDINGGNIDGTTIGATTTANGSFNTITGATINATSVIDTPDIETARISARDGTTAINIADSTGAVDVETSLKVQSATGGVLTLKTTDTTGAIGEDVGSIDFYNGDTSTGSTGVQARILGEQDSAGDSTALQFFTGYSTGSGSPTLQKRIQIDGASGSRGDITFYETDGTTASFVYDASAGLTINEAGSDRDFTVKSDNNAAMLVVDGTNDKVGVGLSSPNPTFHVKGPNTSGYGTMTIEGNADEVDPRLSLYGFSTTAGTTRDYVLDIFGDVSEKGARYDVPSSYYQSWTIAGAKKMTLDDSGQLGIGVSSPDALLHLDGTTPYIRFTRAGTPTWEIRNNNHATGYGLSFYSVTDSKQLASFQQDEAVFNEDANAINFRVESQNKNNMFLVDGTNDRVGIGGTTAPDALLHLWTQNSGSGTGTPSGNADELLLENNSNCGLTILTENLASIHFGKEADTDIGKITYSMSSNDMSFVTNTATQMVLRDDGDLSLSSSKHLNFNDKADMTAATASTTATTQTSIYSFSATTYTGAKLLVCVTDSTATERYITELLVTHDGTTAVSTEYGQVATDTALATFDVDISGGNVRLLATPASTNSMTFKVMSTQLLA